MSIENNVTPIRADSFSFDESKFKIRSRSLMVVGQPEVPSVIRILVKSGMAKTENQAVTIVLIGVGIIIAASVFLVTRSVSVEPAVLSPVLLNN